MTTVVSDLRRKAKRTALAQRHLILFRFASGCGLRVSEIVNLRIGDVDLDRLDVRVRQSKGNKARTVPIWDRGTLDDLPTRNLPATVQATRSQLQAPGASLNAIAADLTDEQRQALGMKIVEQQLAIVESGQRSDQQHHDSARDINVFVNQVGALERQTRSDVEAAIHAKTASATTDIRVKKSNNQNVVYIVVAIAVAVVALLLLAR